MTLHALGPNERDRLVQELAERDATIAALRAALRELAQLARDANATLAAVAKVSAGVAEDGTEVEGR